MGDQAGHYSGWRRERFGPFAGLSGRQAAAVVLAWLPPLAAVGRSRWDTALPLAAVSLLLTALVSVPIRRRPAIRWLLDVLLFAAGRAAGWSTFRLRVLDQGSAANLNEPDLPGIAAALRFHNGPAMGDCVSICVIQDPAVGRWAATAAITHPGLGNADAQTRDGYAAQLGGLLAAAAAAKRSPASRSRSALCPTTAPAAPPGSPTGATRTHPLRSSPPPSSSRTSCGPPPCGTRCS